MDKNTVYILQKDLPEAKAGTELRFDGDIDYDYVATNGEECWYKKHYVENNPEWFKPKEEPKKLDKEKEFQKVLKCLKNNKVVVDTREDGIYIRLAGRESDGEAFTLHFALAYPFPKLTPKEEVNESKPTEKKQWEDEDDDFLWTNELVMEFVNFHEEQKGIHWLSEDIEKFKKSKSKKEEPQWEILEIECYGGEIRKLIDGEYRLYTDGVGFTATYLLQRSDSKIKTVKRLSDGEVFTVGDKVSRSYKVPRELKKVTEEFIIGDFFFEAGVNLMASSSKDHYQCQHIRDIEKVYPNPSPKEEQVPIKVEIMEFGYGKPQENKGKFYVANFNLPNNAKLPTEKYQSIKSAIEDVLNEDKIKHEKLLSKIESKVRLANMINTQANYLKETLDYINSLK